MQNTITNLPATIAPAKPAKPARAKRITKAKTAATIPATIIPAKAPLVHFHREAGLQSGYGGASKPINANRKTAIKLTAHARKPSTERDMPLLYNIRKTYGTDKPFPARGLDNAVAAVFINAGILEPVAGTGAKHTFADGHSGYTDGQTQLLLRFTASGKTYGSVTA
jgi:hypothetical protein